MKNRILLENYYLPGDLEDQIEAFFEHYKVRALGGERGVCGCGEGSGGFNMPGAYHQDCFAQDDSVTRA